MDWTPKKIDMKKIDIGNPVCLKAAPNWDSAQRCFWAMTTATACVVTRHFKHHTARSWHVVAITGATQQLGQSEGQI